MKRFFVGVIFFSVLLGLRPAQAIIYIDITQFSNRSFPVALVPPVHDGGSVDTKNLNQKFISVVQKDLRLMGLFRFIDPAAFLEDPKKKAFTASTIDFASWAVLDALAVAKGRYRLDGNHVELEMHLFDVLLRKELTARQYKFKTDQVDLAAHRFANEVVRILTGEKGVFDTKIAFIGETNRVKHIKELFVMDFNGSNQRQLTRDRSIALSPAWSKDGRSIFFASYRGGKGPQLYRYDLQKEKTYRITRFPGMAFGLELDPVEDLLGTTLTKDGNSEIYLLTLKGRIHKRLTRNADIDVNLSFSPDGQEAAFVSNRDGYAQVYKMDRSGRNVKRLTFKGRNNTAPAWSPRGDKILFAGMDTDGQFDVFSMRKDGSDMVRLTYDTRNNEEPNWSPGSHLITFRSNRTGRFQIYSMRPDGRHQIRLTRSKRNDSMPKWGPRPQ